jgi:hypothetical protein
VDTLRKRKQLANLLVDAAELEHSVLCQYLFVAFSMKRHYNEGGVSWDQLELMRRWESSLLLIARQEMEHFALVSNLLTAIGEAPHFARPNFPIRSNYFPVYDPPSLEPFGLGPLRRLIRLEQPANNITPQHSMELAQIFPHTDASPDSLPKRTVGQLYEEIEDLFKELARESDCLFIGPPFAQRTTPQVIPVPLRGISLPPNAKLYDVDIRPVTDLPSALKVIDQIISEGEGISVCPGRY